LELLLLEDELELEVDEEELDLKIKQHSSDNDVTWIGGIFCVNS